MQANFDGTSAELQPNKNTEDINRKKKGKYVKWRTMDSYG